MRRLRAFWHDLCGPGSPRTAALLLLGVFLACGLSRVTTSSDSRWSVFVALNLWRHQHTYLDDFESRLEGTFDYTIECIEADGTAHTGVVRPCNGRRYDRFPIGGPVLGTPLVIAQVAILRAAQPLLSRIHSPDPVIEGFLRGDAEVAHARIEMEGASFLVALASVFLYLIARGYLPERRAVALALLFALGTSAYSIGARALWGHTWSLVLIPLVILLLERAREKPALAIWAGFPVALCYTVRPTNSLLVVAITIYVALRQRRQLLGYLLAAAPVAAAFFAYNYSVYHSLFSPYQMNHGELATLAVFFRSIACNLASPARGLFVFTPVFLFSMITLARSLSRKGGWRSPLAPWLAGFCVAFLISVGIFGVEWWGGHTYGPRYLADLTPILVLALIPYLERWTDLRREVRWLFLALALVGLLIHLRGGWSGAVYEWNAHPNNVDQHTERVWDWRDPPWLR